MWSNGHLKVFALQRKLEYLWPMVASEFPICFEDAIFFLGLITVAFNPNEVAHDWLTQCLGILQIPIINFRRILSDVILFHHTISLRNIANFEEANEMLENDLDQVVKVS